MSFSDETIRKLTSPPSPEILQMVARALYETAPMQYPGKYGSGQFIVPWDSTLLSDGAREICAQYAATAIAAWQKAILVSED